MSVTLTELTDAMKRLNSPLLAAVGEATAAPGAAALEEIPPSALVRQPPAGRGPRGLNPFNLDGAFAGAHAAFRTPQANIAAAFAELEHMADTLEVRHARARLEAAQEQVERSYLSRSRSGRSNSAHSASHHLAHNRSDRGNPRQRNPPLPVINEEVAQNNFEDDDERRNP